MMKNCTFLNTAELYRFFNIKMCFVALVCLVVQISAKNGLSVVYEWSQLEYEYESEAEREADIISKTFIPGHPIPLDVDVYYGSSKSKIFVSGPRIATGIPATLSTVTKKKLNGNPILRPYPSWSWHRNVTKKCGRNRIVSAFRVKVNECGRLWVMDAGLLGNRVSCRPQILAFDLGTNRLIHRYEIPASQLKFISILATPIVDVRDKECKNTFVYMADTQTCSIIVHDVQNKSSWKISDKTFCPRLDYTIYSILGDVAFIPDGVLGMDLEPYKPGRDRKLFYHALSSPTENWVYTSYIRDQNRFKYSATSSPDIFHTYSGQRTTQTAAEAIDSRGIAYFGLMSNVTMNCWNTKTEYGIENIDTIDNDKDTLQFVSGVKVIKNKSGVEELWILTDRLHKFITGKLSTNEINFRILSAKIEDIIEGTKCAIGYDKKCHDF